MSATDVNAGVARSDRAANYRSESMDTGVETFDSLYALGPARRSRDRSEHVAKVGRLSSSDADVDGAEDTESIRDR